MLSLLCLILGLISGESRMKTFKFFLIIYRSLMNLSFKAFLKTILKFYTTKQLFAHNIVNLDPFQS